MRSRRLGEIRRKSLNRSEHGGTSLPFSGRRLHSVGGTSGLVWPSQFTHAHFKLRVQRHRIVTATLALQPSLRARYHLGGVHSQVCSKRNGELALRALASSRAPG